MTADLVTNLGICSLAASVAVLLVLALRQPLRRLIGARLAYGLWLLVPIAMLASFTPVPSAMTEALSHLLPQPATVAPVAQVLNATPAATEPATMIITSVAPALKTLDISVLLYVWLAGAAGFATYLIFGQRRAIARLGLLGEAAGFTRAASREAGPALIGLFRPRIVLPTDFETRFDPREQRLILAHERTHLNDGHLWINGLTALIRMVNWFNPLVHLGAFHALVDQELACDAAVVARFPGERRTYAQAMLKSQLTCVSLPLGCTWPSRSSRLLQERLTMIAYDKPTRLRLMAGAALVGALCLGAAAAAVAASAATRSPTPQATPRPAPASSVPTSSPRAVLSPSATPARATPATAAAVTPTLVGMACFSNSCNNMAGGPRDAQAVDAAVKAGDAKAAALAGGTPAEVVAALIKSGHIPTRPDGQSIEDRINLDSAAFITDASGRLGFKASLNGGGSMNLFLPDLQGVSAPSGTQDVNEALNQEQGQPAGSVAITARVEGGTDDNLVRIVGFRAPDGTILPAPAGR